MEGRVRNRRGQGRALRRVGASRFLNCGKPYGFISCFVFLSRFFETITSFCWFLYALSYAFARSLMACFVMASGISFSHAYSGSVSRSSHRCSRCSFCVGWSLGTGFSASARASLPSRRVLRAGRGCAMLASLPSELLVQCVVSCTRSRRMLTIRSMPLGRRRSSA